MSYPSHAQTGPSLSLLWGFFGSYHFQWHGDLEVCWSRHFEQRMNPDASGYPSLLEWDRCVETAPMSA